MQENHSATQTGTPNKLADFPIRTLILSMGMPMVLSMVLQAVYNIVDTVFISHMKNGATAVLALTDSYSIQLLIVAVGVGTGIGINALLSKTLGERNSEKAACIAGNGIFWRSASMPFFCCSAFSARSRLSPCRQTGMLSGRKWVNSICESAVWVPLAVSVILSMNVFCREPVAQIFPQLHKSLVPR